MKDMWMIIYDALIADETILSKVGKEQIKFYEVAETLDQTKPFIVIDSFSGPQSPAFYGSDSELSQQFNFQINIETFSRTDAKLIAKAIKDVMWSTGFAQLPGGLDEYFKETKRFVDARRYRKNTPIYDTDY